jgi:hypothetical protein
VINIKLLKFSLAKSKFNISLLRLLSISLASVAAITIAWAAFSDKGQVLGSSFSVGSSDLKLVENLSGGFGSDNLKDELTGPSFNNIVPNWSADYLIKIYNNRTSNMQLMSNSNYTTANDPDDLRSYIFVEPFEWADANNDGTVNDGELGNSFGKKTIIKWKTEGFEFGQINVGEAKGLVLRFSAGTLSDTKQGKSALYDFEFSAIQL